jgi:hypothetical protein
MLVAIADGAAEVPCLPQALCARSSFLPAVHFGLDHTLMLMAEEQGFIALELAGGWLHKCKGASFLRPAESLKRLRPAQQAALLSGGLATAIVQLGCSSLEGVLRSLGARCSCSKLHWLTGL